MSVLDVRAAMMAQLKVALGPKVTVEPHRGRFADAEEIQRFALKAPVVLVAILRIGMTDIAGGMAILPVSFGIFILTRDQPQLPRGDGAIALVEAVTLAVRNSTWGRDDTSEPADLDARNLYASAIDKLGVALWGIGFDQTITDPQIDQTTLDAMHPFATFHQDIDMAPADGLIDITETDTLPQ